MGDSPLPRPAGASSQTQTRKLLRWLGKAGLGGVLLIGVLGLFGNYSIPMCQSTSAQPEAANHALSFDTSALPPSEVPVTSGTRMPSYLRILSIDFTAAASAQVPRPAVCGFIWDNIYTFDNTFTAEAFLTDDATHEPSPIFDAAFAWTGDGKGNFVWQPTTAASVRTSSKSYLTLGQDSTPVLQVAASRTIELKRQFLAGFMESFDTKVAKILRGFASGIDGLAGTTKIESAKIPISGFGKHILTVPVRFGGSDIGTFNITYENAPSLLLESSAFDGLQKAQDGDAYIGSIDAERRDPEPFEWLPYEGFENAYATVDDYLAHTGAPRNEGLGNHIRATINSLRGDANNQSKQDILGFIPAFQDEKERLPANPDFTRVSSSQVADACRNDATLIRSNFPQINEFDRWLIIYSIYRDNLGFKVSNGLACGSADLPTYLQLAETREKFTNPEDAKGEDKIAGEWAARLTALSTGTKWAREQARARAIEESLTGLTRDTVNVVFNAQPNTSGGKLFNEPAIRPLIVTWFNNRPIPHFGCFHRHKNPTRYSALLEVAWDEKSDKSTIFYFRFKRGLGGKVSEISHQPATLRQVFVKVRNKLPNGDDVPASERMPIPLAPDDECRKSFLSDARLDALNDAAFSKNKLLVGIPRWHETAKTAEIAGPMNELSISQ